MKINIPRGVLRTLVVILVAVALEALAHLELFPAEWRGWVYLVATAVLSATGVRNLYQNPDGTDASQPYERLKLPKL